MWPILSGHTLIYDLELGGKTRNTRRMEKFAFTLLQLTVVSKLSSRDLVPSKLDPSLFLRSKTTGQTAELDRLQIFLAAKAAQ